MERELEGMTFWHQELRSGIFRSLTRYRGLLTPDGPRLSQDERRGLTDLLTLLGEIVSSIDPSSVMTRNDTE